MEELPQPFEIGDYFASRKSARYQLGASDVESKTMQEIIGLADKSCKDLWDNMTLSYPDFDGNPLLREEVAKLYDITKGDVLILGPQDGVFVALTCLTNYLQKIHGGPIHAIYTYPCYQALSEPLSNKQCQADRLEIKDTGTCWQLSLDELKSLIKPNTKLLVVNLPHSPTGYAPSKANWDEMVKLCQEHDIFLFADEMYWWLNAGDPLTPACMVYRNGISLGGLAKTCGVPGLRIGWLCTQNKELLKIMKGFKDYTSQINCTPGEILGLITLRNREKVLEEARKTVAENLVILREFIGRHSDILECHEVKAGTHTVMRLKGWTLELGQGKAEGFCDALFKEEKVALLPATVYNYHRDDYVRVGFGKKSFRDALGCLENFLKRRTPEDMM